MAYVEETQTYGFYVEIDVHDPHLLAEIAEGDTVQEQLEALLQEALDPAYCGASVEYIDEESDDPSGPEAE